MGHLVTLVPGDGIGPEVTAAALLVLDAVGADIDWDTRHLGTSALDRGEASAVPAGTVESARLSGCVLKGPVSTPRDGGFRSPNTGLRTELGLFVQIRPVRAVPVAGGSAPPLDVVVVRQTGEDLYAGWELAPGSPAAVEALRAAGADDVSGSGVSLKAFSPAAVRRTAGFALRWAQAHGRRRVTVVHKATVMRETDGLFLRVCRQVAAERPGGGPTAGVELDDALVDNACAQLVRRPGAFDVLLTGMLYGDVLSDLAAAVAGGVGLAPGAAYGPDAAVFEAAHGSAPRYAGQDRANPVGLIRSAALMLRHLGDDERAARVESAVDAVLAEGRDLTYDLAPGTPVGTRRCAEAIAERAASSA